MDHWWWYRRYGCRCICNAHYSTGGTRYGSGANTRVRGALRTAVDTIPAPWGKPAADWDTWAQMVTNRTKAIAIVSSELFAAGTDLPDAPWRALAS